MGEHASSAALGKINRHTKYKVTEAVCHVLPMAS